MSFSDTQIRKLQRDIKASDVRTREVNGKELSYIEGWHAIAEANRIFGFDGWSRETIEYRCVVSRENRGNFHALYVAKIRITVRTEGASVIREGFGTGDAQAPTAGEAHDKAIKTAETDATKRAFATFGKPFGLSLYLGGRRRTPQGGLPDIQRRRTLQKLGPNGRYFVPARSQQSVAPRIPEITGHSNGGTASPIDLPTTETPSNEAGTDLSDRPGLIDAAIALAGEPTDALPQTESTTTDGQSDGAASVPFKNAPAKEDTATPDIARQAESFLLIDRPRRRRDPAHLKHVANQPCLICSRTPSDAHHLKFAQPKAMAKKVSDEFTVPLCRTHHRQLHHGGDEVAWWIDMEVDPLPIAQDLWLQSKDGTSRIDTTKPVDGQ